MLEDETLSRETVSVTPLVSGRYEYEANTQNLPAMNKRRELVSGGLLESTQLWLPLSARRESNEGSPEEVRH